MIEVPCQGGCQCRAIRYQCNARPFVAYTCHCDACRKLTSSAFATCMQVPAESLQFLHGSPLSATRIADSGNALETYYCGDCGSAMVSASSARPRLRTIYVGSLDDAAGVDVSAHIWTSHKLPWVILPASHRIFPEGGDWRPDYADDPSRLERRA